MNLNQNTRSLLGRARQLAASLLSYVLLLAAGAARAESPGPFYFMYQVPFPASPASGAAALADLSFDARAKAVLKAIACGSEFQFLRKYRAREATEDSTMYVIGKLEWIAGNPRPDETRRFTEACRFTLAITGWDVCPLFLPSSECDAEEKIRAFEQSPEWRALRGGDVSALNKKFVDAYPVICGKSKDEAGQDVVGVIQKAVQPNPTQQILDVDFTLTSDCLKEQINTLVAGMKPGKRMGTDTPCHVFWPSHGDWDMAVRNVMRIGFMDQRSPGWLYPYARDNLRNQLMTAEGRPAERTYSLLGCGNTEESTGTAQERADERSWLEDAWNDVLEDAFWWFVLIIIAIVIGLIVAGYVAAGTAGAMAVAGVGTVATVAVIIAAQSDIPETENHLLMINSSKYLKNQMLINELAAASSSSKDYRDDQKYLETWLLETMQHILKKDFIEYNSRPYQRMSINALLNLADFSTDPEVRLGAELVLDYASAKFAVGSHQGRRLGPLRRLRDSLKLGVLTSSPKNNGLLDLGEAADHQAALGLLYSGQVQQLRGNKISLWAAGGSVYGATSPYRPPDLVVDLAIDKQTRVFQRLHHHTQEIYSSGRSFLIAAGGVTADQAYTGTGMEWLDQLFASKVENDEGAALPTVLFVGQPDRQDLGGLLRFEGERPAPDAKYPSFNHNLCVYDGFACGINLMIPPDMLGAGCLRQAALDLSNAAKEWLFMDSKACPAYAESPRFFLVVWKRACPHSTTECFGDFGFWEIVDAGDQESLQAFRTAVISENLHDVVAPMNFVGPTAMQGTYVTRQKREIVFNADAHQRDADRSGLESVDHTGVDPAKRKRQADIDDWPHAGGDEMSTAASPIVSDGKGRVRITNPRLQQTLTLDFSDAKSPHRGP